MAARDRAFRASVFRFIRRSFHTSKAWVSMSSFAVVFTAVRCALIASQVHPISAASKSTAGAPSARGPGQVQCSMLPKRVVPTTVAVGRARSTVAKGRATPCSASASAACT
jgi:hypothetical protein